MGARGATSLTRAGTAAARTFALARFAGGALSAAVVILEANAIHSTLKSIKAGNPCEKAQKIRRIRDGIQDLPDTANLEDECLAYLKALASRRLPQSQEVIATLAPDKADDFPEAKCTRSACSLDSSVGITEGEGNWEEDGSCTLAPPNAYIAPPSIEPALLFRIHRNKRRQDVNIADESSPVVPEQSLGESELNLLV